jgi:putative FmdB family regulatory protein
MPIYEYRCDACHKQLSVFVRSLRNPVPVQCRYCQSERLTRLISRVATPKSDESRLESMADPASIGGVDENDPKSMSRWMKKMAGEMGEDFDDEMLAEMDSGGDDSQMSETSDPGYPPLA